MILATNVASPGFVSAGLYSTWDLGRRRLVDLGVIYRAEHLCAATKNEAIALLRGDLGSLAEVCRWSRGVHATPELERRTNTSAGSNLIRELSESASTQSMDLPPKYSSLHGKGAA
jgi:hypothetical protein